MFGGWPLTSRMLHNVDPTDMSIGPGWTYDETTKEWCKLPTSRPLIIGSDNQQICTFSRRLSLILTGITPRSVTLCTMSLTFGVQKELTASGYVLFGDRKHKTDQPV